MSDYIRIDTDFDFRSDTPPGKDPDSASPTLKRYHKLLWSKSLPSGAKFELDDTTPGAYLHHKSKLGEFFIASDAVIPCFTREQKIAHIVKKIPKSDLDEFNAIGYTIGGMMIFPGNRIDGKMTINGVRGFHPRIKDRFDLTIECIRRHYQRIDNPLAETLNRYGDFFDLFVDFRGYVDFFLLQDMVSEDFSRVEFFSPFDDFNTSPLPSSTEEYAEYKRLATEFINSRNQRIARSY